MIGAPESRSLSFLPVKKKYFPSGERIGQNGLSSAGIRLSMPTGSVHESSSPRKLMLRRPPWLKMM